jgi:transcriptional regulator with XRE-family HTH domain
MSFNGTHPIMTERAAEVALARHQDSCATGNRLYYMRQRAGVSQAELAAYVGVSRSTIQNIEHGRRSLSQKERATIARALGCSIATLTATADSRPPWVTSNGPMSEPQLSLGVE